MTKGDMGGDPDTRHGEQERSAELLTARELDRGGYRDTQLTENMNRLIHDIEDVLKRVKPVSLPSSIRGRHAPGPPGLVQGHRGRRRGTSKTLFSTKYPTTQNFSPTVFVDINETFHDKISLLLMHNSQVMKTNIEGLSIKDVVQSTAIFRGIQGRVRYAEGFVPLRLFINV